jgi:hypothetical protein
MENVPNAWQPALSDTVTLKLPAEKPVRGEPIAFPPNVPPDQLNEYGAVPPEVEVTVAVPLLPAKQLTFVVDTLMVKLWLTVTDTGLAIPSHVVTGL